MPPPAYEPLLGGRPQPGVLEPGVMHALAVAMFSALPPETALRTAGALHQMALTGLPHAGLLPLLAGVARAPEDPSAYAGTLSGTYKPLTPAMGLPAFKYEKRAGGGGGGVTGSTTDVVVQDDNDFEFG